MTTEVNKPALANEVRVWNETRDYILRHIAPGEQDENLLDTLDGETNLLDRLRVMVRFALEREAQAEALGKLIANMQTRQKRLLAGARSSRDAVTHAMQEADGLRKLPAPDFNARLGGSFRTLIITDVNALPKELTKTKREPKKAEIRKRLEAGDKLNGAALGNPRPTLTITTL